MDSEPGRSLIAWTVRIAVVLYVAGVWCWLPLRRTEGVTNASRRRLGTWYWRFWAASWALCMVHVACAFHFQHQWSQAAALQHTAELTERVTGWYWSGGLYINYAFLLLWGMDVVAARTARGFDVGRLGRSSVAMHLIAVFMVFNATAVFGPRWWMPLARFVSIAALLRYAGLGRW